MNIINHDMHWLKIVIVIIVIAAISTVVIWEYKTGKKESFDGFRIGGYRLGSYDPNMYISEITRRP